MSAFTTPGKHSAVRKQWRQIGRGKTDSFFLEHERAVLESLSGISSPSQVLVSRNKYEREPERWERLAAESSSSWFLLEKGELSSLSSAAGDVSLCGVYRARSTSLESLAKETFVLATWKLQDPGNLGTIVRSLQAFAGGGLLCIGGCRPWSSKVARASAGTILETNLHWVKPEEGEEALEEISRDKELRTLVVDGGESLESVDFSSPGLYLLGNESRGVPEEIARKGRQITIPMRRGVESLNVATSGALLCYEFARNNG